MFKDPVCNMMVDEKKAQHISEVNGQKVYLCSSNCKSQFEQNPNKYGYWVVLNRRAIEASSAFGM
jgi:YHS domain-containing protein